METPSENQIQANQPNAQHSTGPKTPAGKHRSSQNALRHGLTGRIVVLPSEDMNVYLKLSREIVDNLRPEGPLERQIAQTVADTQWRLNRVRSIEDGMLALGHDGEAGNFDAGHPALHAALTAARAFRGDSQSFVNLSIYEQRLQRGMSQALKQLKELQADRRNSSRDEMSEAIRLHKLHKMKSMPWNPKDDGFVCSRADVEAENRRRERSDDALHAHYDRYNLAKFQARSAA